MARFKDHFSAHAADYAAHRPAWPEELFRWLSDRCSGHTLAWDCATGNGQAALALAGYFRNVVATDASAEQIAQARTDRRIDYRIEPAEQSTLTDASVDLVVVAQAFHWFDRRGFLAEAGRVLKDGGVLAVLNYRLLTVDPAVDRVVRRLWGEILDGWWPPERALVDLGLAGVPLPFDDLACPEFAISVDWSRSELVGYLGTWSSVRRYRRENGTDPVGLIEKALFRAWPDRAVTKRVTWPVDLKVVRKPR